LLHGGIFLDFKKEMDDMGLLLVRRFNPKCHFRPKSAKNGQPIAIHHLLSYFDIN